MHDFDTSIPQFVTQVRGICSVVTPEFISKVLHVPRVSHPNYPGCPRLRTMSKDKLLSLFYETPSSWGDRQNTSCTGFTKDLKFLNMTMTFVLHPLSHYNFITEPHARFLLSLLEDLTINFHFHFILFLMDVYRDTVTHDKLIFPSAIMRIFRHSFVSYPESIHFTVSGAISVTSVRWSEAQLRSKRPRIETAIPLTYSTPLSSSMSGVMLEAFMAQLERTDARLDILSTVLYQVNTYVSCIARWQARMGGFTASPSPSLSLQALEDEDDDDGFDDNDNDDVDEDANS